MMSNNKKVGLILAAIILVAVLWYLLSPLFMPIERNDPSPLDNGQISSDTTPQQIIGGEQVPVNDNLKELTEDEMMDFLNQTLDMDPQVIEMDDDMPQGPTVVAEADFKSRAHDVKGKAVLIESSDGTVLRFEDFETVNGPDLKIYLGSELGDNDYVDLGPILATKGSANYAVPAGTDTSKYNKVLVWCDAFDVLFSYAEL
jgi:hypothetical protein